MKHANLGEEIKEEERLPRGERERERESVWGKNKPMLGLLFPFPFPFQVCCVFSMIWGKNMIQGYYCLIRSTSFGGKYSFHFINAVGAFEVHALLIWMEYNMYRAGPKIFSAQCLIKKSVSLKTQRTTS